MIPNINTLAHFKKHVNGLILTLTYSTTKAISRFFLSKKARLISFMLVGYFKPS